MDKCINFMKKNKKKFLITLLVFLIVLGFGSNLFAAINPNSYELEKDQSALNIVVKAIASFVGFIASGTILKLISVLLLGIAGILWLIIYIVWSALGGLAFPAPDRIIFNEISLLDPNFLNYTNNTSPIMTEISKVVSPLYFTFFIIAGAIMGIAAMIIGIKLALSSIAIEKAQYKELLNKWIVGIVLLFCLHFLILGVFTINEKICEVAGGIVGELVFEPDSNWFTSAATKVVNSISSFFGSFLDSSDNEQPSEEDNKSAFKGYTGLIYYLMINAVGGGTGSGGGLIFVIILLALLGQTVNLIINYVKRLIFLIFLVVFAPLVVAVDVIKKAI